MKAKSVRCLFLPTVALLVWLVPMAVCATALDDYIAKPDPAYSYDLYHVDRTLAYTSYFVRLVSQRWRSSAEVDRPLWEHELQITVPRLLHSASPGTAILIVNGGSNGKPLNEETGALLSSLAGLSGSVVAMINQVPNQPLRFTDEVDNPRKEDAILAYSLDKFLTTGDTEWPVHLAMTKAVVRAMDTVQRVLRAESIGVDDFIVLGGSKRGWTTWLTGAVDGRVKAMVPISIDLPNLEMQFIHHWESYGFYSSAIQDYVDFGLPCRLLSDRGQDLLEIIDPYSYRERYSMDKLVINSAGDQFFAPDSSRFYFGELPFPKDLRYTFNTDHRQGENELSVLDVAISALLWIDDVNRGEDSSRFTWSFAADGSIRVRVQDRPDEVNLVQATSPSARDFRLETIGDAWTRTPLKEVENGLYVASVSPPSSGYTAFAVELVYDALSLPGAPLIRQVLTTDVRITPDVLPFQGTACAAQTTGMTNIGGTVSVGDMGVCALVLVNGRRKYSCGDSQGRFQTAVPLDENGAVTLFAFADGFQPYKQTLMPSEMPVDVQMDYASQGDPIFQMPVTDLGPTDRPNWVAIKGLVATPGGQPVCALVVANGQHQFSCGDNLGHYEMTVPLGEDDGVTVMGFADGFRPWKEDVVYRR